MTSLLTHLAADTDVTITRLVLDPSGTDPTPTSLPAEVLSCPDPDTEVDLAVRWVAALLAEGQDPERIGVTYSVSQPYAPLLESAFDAAGIAWHGPTGSTLRATIVVRQCLALLDMAAGRDTGASGITRLGLLRWLGLGQVLEGGTPITTGSLISLIRDEGLHRDARDWSRALEVIAAAGEPVDDPVDDPANDPANEENPRLSRHQRTAQSARALRQLIERLDLMLEGLTAAPDWATLGVRLLHALDDLHLASGRWKVDPAERDAQVALTTLLTDVLPVLDGDSLGPPDPADLARMIERQLGQRRSRHGISTTGIHVGPVASTRALVFDHVIIVGAAEGLLPAMRTPDPLLPDAARLVLRVDADDLPTAMDEEWSTRRDLLGLLASTEHRHATYARGAMPGRAVASLTRYLCAAPLQQVASSLSALREGPAPVSEDDMAIRRALAMPTPDADRAEQVGSLHAWAAPAPNRHFGSIGIDTGWTLRDQTVSASAIESWLHCPYHFFVRRILGISTDEVADQDVDIIEPKDFGTLLHSALEDLVTRALDEGWAPGPGEPWPAQTLSVLVSILDGYVDDAHARGITGWRPSWDYVYALVTDALPELLLKDVGEVRDVPGLAPAQAEQQFGFEGTPEVAFPLSRGGSVKFRGAIDRIDVSADGTTVGVVDYKSGSSTSFSKGLGIPNRNGAPPREKVQDLVYDVAARVLVPAAQQVRVSFVFVPNRGQGVKVIQPVHDDDRRETLAGIIDALEEAGRSMTFIPAPRGRSDFCPVCQRLGHVARRVAAQDDDV